ncbi:hypothetical protein M409DRAFT_37069 [Zasmidium cellare ATCC 36951]|uniref:Enoyl reductase (ER) domain-containing protein n=1 Tax=Zasmidium cellare ATCC 36951 TaxID=1080233 RepID=A0A6A6CB01_ZASCE|nr:uncharacterized protein M409DRAFT_37069 [Zasmidium cellare ATCC 36951]KAF2164377.1 hypothetical protein M409DRAFT_37069 [Zasmidium cellare ATCC 36951]
MSTNTAAWLTSPKVHPFEIKPAPMWEPQGTEILIRNKAIAINLIDASLQKIAMIPMPYPSIVGHDVAGEVVALGPEHKRFKKGDRVLGMAVGIGKEKKNNENAFQQFTVLQSHMATEIPEGMAFEEAAVIPLGLSTAACGLFQEKPCLGLRYPTEPRGKATGQTVLVWGGSSSVGANGIQLAVAAGYEVVATASPKNFEVVKKLGASQVLDYNASTIEDGLVAAFKGKQLAGVLDCIGGQACTTSVNVVKRVAGTGIVTTTKGGAEKGVEGVTVQRLFGVTLKDNGVGKAVFEDYLPKALKAGTFVPAPAPVVVGKGLESVQTAVDRILKGVSAQKLVVSLE